MWSLIKLHAWDWDGSAYKDFSVNTADIISVETKVFRGEPAQIIKLRSMSMRGGFSVSDELWVRETAEEMEELVYRQMRRVQSEALNGLN